MKRTANQIEVVETQNLAHSLERLRGRTKHGYNDAVWRRALYHAMLMAGTSDSCMAKIREALELP